MIVLLHAYQMGFSAMEVRGGRERRAASCTYHFATDTACRRQLEPRSAAAATTSRPACQRQLQQQCSFLATAGLGILPPVLQVAVMFSFYELAGVVTNLMAGLMGAR